MRILWSSNAPWAGTGYGHQTRHFVPRIKDLGHELAVLAFYGLEGSQINWNGVPIYPRGRAAYGQDVIGAHSAHFRADITISLIDAWVMEPRTHQDMRWVPWFPIDHEPLPKVVREKVIQSFQPIVYSKFGLKAAENAGIEARYIPHGIDSAIYKPGDKRAAREKHNLPTDRFIVGMVAANKGVPSRKSYPQQLEAFAALHREHPDTLLYLHTETGAVGEEKINLPELVELLGIKDAVRFCDQYAQVIGAYSDAAMADLYRAFDVLLSVSMGEGFGIPILESQACGTPVIVGDWTSMSELCFGGWKIDKTDALKFYTPLASYQYIPQPGAILEALRFAYHHRSRSIWDAQMRAGALQYDADRVTREYWKPVLDELAERVENSKRVLAGVAE